MEMPVDFKTSSRSWKVLLIGVFAILGGLASGYLWSAVMTSLEPSLTSLGLQPPAALTAPLCAWVALPVVATGITTIDTVRYPDQCSHLVNAVTGTVSLLAVALHSAWVGVTLPLWEGSMVVEQLRLSQRCEQLFPSLTLLAAITAVTWLDICVSVVVSCLRLARGHYAGYTDFSNHSNKNAKSNIPESDLGAVRSGKTRHCSNANFETIDDDIEPYKHGED